MDCAPCLGRASDARSRPFAVPGSTFACFTLSPWVGLFGLAPASFGLSEAAASRRPRARRSVLDGRMAGARTLARVHARGNDEPSDRGAPRSTRRDQVLFEPCPCEVSNSLERPRLLEEVCSAGDDLEPAHTT